MSNWEKMIASRARHGTFVGTDTAGENDYYEFFGGSGPHVDRANVTIIANFHRAFQLLKSKNVTFAKPVRSLFLSNQ